MDKQMSLVLQKIARNLISEECFSSSERQLQMGDMGGFVRGRLACAAVCMEKREDFVWSLQDCFHHLLGVIDSLWSTMATPAGREGMMGGEGGGGRIGGLWIGVSLRPVSTLRNGNLSYPCRLFPPMSPVQNSHVVIFLESMWYVTRFNVPV